MSILKTYDPTKVNITYKGRQLRMFGDSLFTLARDEVSMTLKKGVKGDSTYIRNANKAGKLTITLQQESPDIPFLEQCNETYTEANKTRGKDAPDVQFVFLIPEINLT